MLGFVLGFDSFRAALVRPQPPSWVIVVGLIAWMALITIVFTLLTWPRPAAAFDRVAWSGDQFTMSKAPELALDDTDITYERPVILVQYGRPYYGRPWIYRGAHPYSYGYPQWGPRVWWRDPVHQFHNWGGYCRGYYC